MSKHKVLFALINADSYQSEGMVEGFENNGYDVIKFDWQRVRFSLGTDRMREMIIDLADLEKPDLIFLHIQNPDALDEYTIRTLQNTAPTVQYTFDVRRKEKIQWMYDYAKFVTHTFFACQEDVDNCIEQGINNVSHLHSSADFNIYKPLPLFDTETPEIIFIGANYVGTNLEFDLAEERQDMVRFLEQEYEDRFGAYGLGQRNKMVNPQQEVKLYNTCQIAICQNNFSYTDYSSDRIWRAMGSGTFVLSKYFKGIEKIFEKEVHLDTWENFDELKQLIDFYLNDEKERSVIAKSGSLLVRENHTWTERIKEMLGKL